MDETTGYPIFPGSESGETVRARKDQQQAKGPEMISLLATKDCRLLDRLPALVFEFNLDGAILFVNSTVAAVTGYRPQELLGRNWQEVFCPGELARHAARLWESLPGREVSGEELQLRGRNGGRLILECNSANEYDGSGRLHRIILFGMDITSQRQAEEAWREGKYTLERRVRERTESLARASEAAEERAREAEEERRLLEALMEYIPEGIVIADAPDLTIRHVSRYAGTTVGGLPEKLKEGCVREEMQHWGLQLPGGRTRVTGEGLPLCRAIRGGEVITNEEWALRRADGSELVLLVNAGPIRDRQGSLTGGVLAWRDITERKRGEAERERLLAELESTFAAIADGVMICGPAGEILRLNPAAQDMLGYSAAEMARPMLERADTARLETVAGRVLPMEEWPLHHALQGRSVRGQVMVLQRRERRVWVSVGAAPLCTQDRRIIGAVVSFTDITPLKELQEQHETYLHTISHDLRLPLTVLSGHAQLLQEAVERKGLEAELGPSLATILHGTERMNSMIADLVDAARLANGHLALRQEEIALARFLPEVLCRAAMALEVARVASELMPDLPKVTADPARLERILLNLLSNALKYSPPPTPVHLRVAGNGKELIFTITDQGRGIAAGDLPHIFDRFYQSSGTRLADSVGLGLYITRIMVEAHGGRIWAESREGEGSTFRFTLPAAGS